MNLPRTYATQHLGCANTLTDIAGVSSWLRSLGVGQVTDPRDADLFVLHTCAFEAANTARSVAEVDALLARLRPDAVLAVIGCLPAISASTLAARAGHDGRLVAIAPREISRLGNLFGLSSGPKPAAAAEDGVARVRISRGCANQCSFCAIPNAQGRTSSLTTGEIASVVREHLAAGFDEIVLASEDAGAWGVDIDSTLPALLGFLKREFPAARFVLSTINPHWMHRWCDAVLELVAQGTIVPRLYCPAQSGSSRVLRRMKRGYDAEVLQAVYERITAVPGVKLFQDILVGHPGEQDVDFEESRRLIETFPPFETRVFVWTAQEGTAALRMKDAPGEEVAARRARTLVEDILGRWFPAVGICSRRERLSHVLSGRWVPVSTNLARPAVPRGAAVESGVSSEEGAGYSAHSADASG